MERFNNEMSFQENFELDLSEDESYSKVDVPEFRDGLSGRFLHDFKFNQSLIMDQDNQRCFVMPLDRETVLQPKSMYDLFNKMVSGYYNIDTRMVKKNMRVVVPPVDDLSLVAPRIVEECSGMRIFMLEKVVTGGNLFINYHYSTMRPNFDVSVFKRSISDKLVAKYGSFTGKHIVQYQINNIDEADKY